ncbi:hypothetical protein WH52_12385 [Tenacibaculum holothuriorum]|uniref:Glycosyltransferase 2-like domain-containing protein n=1 Tax=Tenacibaculum holothuriorum TaxID=1635173 RepID=A0A1Y2PA01_9FLAO|nr:glycosyltransferase [Tenacibaculum holothuriorum]OSY87252.1 hypothetical protein WH52_12385 [Tenacibaculum holothuriorum]
MISVLIPTYNWNAYSLVAELQSQFNSTNIPFEILVVDDASQSELNSENEKINTLGNCSFVELEENIGRSAIRNLLASKAKYKYLLFLDADVIPTHKNFVDDYAKRISDSNKVIVGGIAYKNETSTKLLRWKYGKKYEQVSLEIREKNPSKYFFTANFLIEKKLFSSIQFDENFTKYGYEDVVFGRELEHKGIEIHQIQNEVFHLGIDTNQSFVNKTKQAIVNLVSLENKDKNLTGNIGLLKMYKRLKKFGLRSFLSLFTKQFEKFATQHSSLFFFNLFRLGYLHKVFKNIN